MVNFFDILKNCTSWFDAAAACYDVLCKSKAIKSEENFVAAYFESSSLPIAGETSETNPNLPVLNAITDIVYDEAMGSSFREIGLSECKTRLVERVMEEQANLVDWCDPEANDLTPLLAFIKGVDMAAFERDDVRKFDRRGPLNKQGESAVYLSPEIMAVTGNLEGVGVGRLPQNDINSQLCALKFFPYVSRFPFPRMVALRKLAKSLSGSSANIVQTREKLKVGICLFSNKSLLDFERETELGRFVMAKGNTFTVRYSENHVGVFGDAVAAVVSTAAREGCDILVFPEMVMSEELQDCVSCALGDLEAESGLQLVVAGSGHVRDGNAGRVFDGVGSTIGRYFKYRPYVDGKTRATEALAMPGAQSIVVDLYGLGLVGVAVCRDMTDIDSWIAKQLHYLDQQVLVVPAYSRSIDKAFESAMNQFAKVGQTATVIANYCGAVAPRDDAQGVDTKTVVGRISVPSFEPRPDGSLKRTVLFEDVVRDPDCVGCVNGLCLRVVDIEFAHRGDDGSALPAKVFVGEPVSCGKALWQVGTQERGNEDRG